MTFILLHGALGSASQLDPLIAELSAVDNLRAMEFGGHGNTPLLDRPFTIAGFVAQLAEYVDREGIERADLFGYSMGGYVALAYALAHRERVGRIFTLGTKFTWTPEFAARERARLDPAVIRAKQSDMAEVLMARHAGAGGWESTLCHTAALMQSLGDHPVLGMPELSRVEPRACLMVGDRDAMVGVGETSWASERVRAGELAVLPGTPHPFELVDHKMLAWLITHTPK